VIEHPRHTDAKRGDGFALPNECFAETAKRSDSSGRATVSGIRRGSVHRGVSGHPAL